MKTEPITDTDIVDYLSGNWRQVRFISHPSMCGRYPCWSVWTAMKGRNRDTERKTLREAVTLAIEDEREWNRQLSGMVELFTEPLQPYQKAILKGIARERKKTT